MDDDLECLCSLTDAITARECCEALEEGGIQFALANHSYPQYGLRAWSEGPPILLEISVRAEDLDRAKSCLQRSNGLFPEPEVVGAQDVTLSEGKEVLCCAIVCDVRSDAEEISQAIQSDRIWCTIRREEDGEGHVDFSVDVKAGDVERAVEIADRWLWSKK